LGVAARLPPLLLPLGGPSLLVALVAWVGVGVFSTSGPAWAPLPAANAARPPLVASATLDLPDLCGLGYVGCSRVKTMSGTLDRR